MMNLYVGVSLLEVTVLARRCEMRLVALLLRLDIDSLRAGEDDADTYDARRLLSRCCSSCYRTCEQHTARVHLAHRVAADVHGLRPEVVGQLERRHAPPVEARSHHDQKRL
ncbi:hypothetical protein PR001_g9533 [Phytophthora rubi]|nr:hypothetical protein PR001_g9533 [Phytophthora rubi]